jgi:hypothetical protein
MSRYLVLVDEPDVVAELFVNRRKAACGRCRWTESLGSARLLQSCMPVRDPGTALAGVNILPRRILRILGTAQGFNFKRCDKEFQQSSVSCCRPAPGRQTSRLHMPGCIWCATCARRPDGFGICHVQQPSQTG